MQKGAGVPLFGNAMYCYGILSIIRFTKKVTGFVSVMNWILLLK